jgi:hypothetical protein
MGEILPQEMNQTGKERVTSRSHGPGKAGVWRPAGAEGPSFDPRQVTEGV